MAYCAERRYRPAEPRYAARVVRGRVVVRMLEWRAPGPAGGPGFPADAWRGR